MLPLSASAEVFGTSAGYLQYRLNDGKSAIEVGIGASAQLSDYVDVRGIASIIQDGKDDQARLNIGLVDIHTASQRLGVRVGRVQNELGFYTSQLNWAPARDIHMPPQGIYRENFRYMLRSGDGVQVYGDLPVNSHLRLGAEVTYIAKPVFYQMRDITKVWNGIGGELDVDDSWARGISFSADLPDIRTTLRYDQQQLNFKIQNTNMIGLFDGEVNTKAHYIGGKTELSETLDVVYEYIEIEKYGSTWDKMDQLAKMVGVDYSSKDRTKGYGLSFGYQVCDFIKLTFGHSSFYSSPKDKYGTNASKLTGFPSKDYYIEDNFIGMKYRRNEWISTLEVHQTKGTTTMVVDDSKSKGTNNNRIIFTVTRVF